MKANDRRARWEHYDHGADVGVRGIAGTKAGAFEQAALALTAVITNPEGVAPEHMLELRCEAPDEELLLAEWLDALIYEMATRRMLFGRFQVELEKGRLRARAWGEPVDRARHRPAVEPKGTTLTTLSVYRNEQGEWVAQTVVDV